MALGTNKGRKRRMNFYDTRSVEEIYGSLQNAVRRLDEKYNFKPLYLYRGVEDLEKLFEQDMKNSDGFIIDTSVDLDRLKQQKNVEHNYNDLFKPLRESSSIFSDKFHKAQYICSCGKLVSEQGGTVCSFCGKTAVKTMYTRGWIQFKARKKYKVFNPGFLALILPFKTINTNKSSKQTLALNALKKDKRLNITALQQHPGRLIEFMEKYGDKAMCAKLKDNDEALERAFTSKIPVMSELFRPFKNINGAFEQKIESHSYNKVYASISKLAQYLDHCSVDDITAINETLTNISKYLAHLHALVLHDIGKNKKSYGRDKLFGARRISCGSRTVLESFDTCLPDGVMLPYSIFGKMTIDIYYDRYSLPENGLTPDLELYIRKGISTEETRQVIAKVFVALTEQERYLGITRHPVIYSTAILSGRLVALCQDEVIKMSEQLIQKIRGDKDGDTTFNMYIGSYSELFHYSLFINTIVNPITMKFNGSLIPVESNYLNVYSLIDKKCENIMIGDCPPKPPRKEVL